MADITVKELNEKRKSGEEIVLIDVREPTEFDEFNLDGKLIPLGTLPDHLEDLASYKDQEVIVHCRSGARSDRAKHYMMANGFKNVRNLLGGVLAWQEQIEQ